MLRSKANVVLATFLSVALTGCLSTAPKLGGGQGAGTITGSAGGENTENANSQLERCDAPLGTLSVFEDRDQPWWRAYQSRAPKLGSTLPVIRLMVQQSGCFVIVERGAAMAAVEKERALMNSGESRAGSNFGKGQMVAADYTLSPSITFSEKGTSGLSGLVGGFLGPVGALVAAGFKTNEAATTMLLIDNRSAVQISAAVGNAENKDFNFGFLGVGGGIAGARGFTDTPEGKILTAAFADSFNQMVNALRNYKAQQVKGGLGKGGQLKVGN